MLGEVERLTHAATERERAFAAERAAWAERLAALEGSKGWRAEAALDRARRRGARGAVEALGGLGVYLARVGYHLGVPYHLRRDLWYRRHTGKGYAAYYRALQAAAAPSAPTGALAAAVAGAAPAHARQALGPDILYLAPGDRAQGQPDTLEPTLRALAATGRRCFAVSPQLAGWREGRIESATLAPHLEWLTLPGDGADVSQTDDPLGGYRPAALRWGLAALNEYRIARDLHDVTVIIRSAGWEPLAHALRRDLGWKLVYLPDAPVAPGDAPRHETRKSPETPETPETEARLLAGCDLVAATAPGERAGSVEPVGTVTLAGTPQEQAETLLGAIERLYAPVTIVIVTYRNLEKTMLTLQSVLEKTRRPNYELLVVDNGAQPALRAYLQAMQARFPQTVRVVFNEENLGFAGGNNVGLRLARERGRLDNGGSIVLLNDDVIVTPSWLARLLWYLRDPAVGIVGPVTNECGNEARVPVPYTAEQALSQPAMIDEVARRRGRERMGESFDIGVLAMYCVALRGEVVVAVGELDERFRVGMFEDDDYALRVRNAGLRVVCAEDVFVHHFGQSSFSKMGEDAYQRLFDANRALFERKWGVTWNPHLSQKGYQDGPSR